MAKQTLSNIVRGKHYYRDKFRATVTLLIFSLIVMISLGLFIFYEELTQPTPNFYASNSAGAGFITKLNPLSEPNQTNQYLLAPDPPEEMAIKSIDVGAQTPTTSPGANGSTTPSSQGQPPAQTGTGAATSPAPKTTLPTTQEQAPAQGETHGQ